MYRPYFTGPFRLLPGVQKYNCSRLAFKSQIDKIWCQSNQKLLYHSQHEKISPIQKLILKIQQILGYHELNRHTHFWTSPPKNHWINLQFIPSIHSWDTVNFRILWPDWSQLFFNHAYPKMFWSIFNSCEFVSTCKKSSYFKICSGDTVKKILQSDWLRTFSPL